MKIPVVCNKVTQNRYNNSNNQKSYTPSMTSASSLISPAPTEFSTGLIRYIRSMLSTLFNSNNSKKEVLQNVSDKRNRTSTALHTALKKYDEVIHLKTVKEALDNLISSGNDKFFRVDHNFGEYETFYYKYDKLKNTKMIGSDYYKYKGSTKYLSHRKTYGMDGVKLNEFYDSRMDIKNPVLTKSKNYNRDSKIIHQETILKNGDKNSADYDYENNIQVYTYEFKDGRKEVITQTQDYTETTITDSKGIVGFYNKVPFTELLANFV